MREPTQLVMAGDWHGNTEWAIRMILDAYENKADVILQLGDFGIWPGPGGKHYLDKVNEALVEMDIIVYFVDGNHEDFTQFTDNKIVEDGTRQFRSNIFHLPRGHSWEWFGKKWLALGGAVSVDREYRTEGRSWWPQEVTTDEDVERALAVGPVDVLVTHDAPLDILTVPGVSDGTFPFHPKWLPPSKANQAKIQRVLEALKPTDFWHGHYHVVYRQTLEHSDGTPWRATGLACDGMSGNSVIYEEV